MIPQTMSRGSCAPSSHEQAKVRRFWCFCCIFRFVCCLLCAAGVAGAVHVHQTPPDVIALLALTSKHACVRAHLCFTLCALCSSVNAAAALLCACALDFSQRQCERGGV